MARRKRSAPKITSIILSISIIFLSVILAIILFPVIGIASLLLILAVLIALRRKGNHC